MKIILFKKSKNTTHVKGHDIKGVGITGIAKIFFHSPGHTIHGGGHLLTVLH